MKGTGPVMLSAHANAASRTIKLRPKCKGMRWSVLAGFGRVESHHAAGHRVADDGTISPRIISARLDGSGAGGNTSQVPDTDGGTWDGDTSYDRAVGPMQFLPSTWNGPTGQDGNGDGIKDPHNAFDTALGAAVYLCGTGHSDLSDDAQLRKAALRYSHAGWYADEVLQYVHQYDQAGDVLGNTGSNGPVPVSMSLPGPPAAYQGGATACSYTDPTGGRRGNSPRIPGDPEQVATLARRNRLPDTALRRRRAPTRPRLRLHPRHTRLRHRTHPGLGTGRMAAQERRRAGRAVRDLAGRIWSINHSHDEGGWGRPYDHGLNNPHTVTGGHYDHVHVTYKD
ncbi:lytic transglycosylase domain-containing protein [Streptomyces sp. NPDC058695]|uniref:lytic transglycosylase domain-containing protein n=1 Tax=Streptomyces sp. NPDC058695 TaxID=3346604 RepID=UPI00366377F0